MPGFHRRVKAEAEFGCGPELLYGILTDYDSYKDWMPQIRDSALLAKAGELAIVRIEHATLECIHTVNQSVLSRVVEGDLELKSLEWRLAALPTGGCRVTLLLEGRTGLPFGSGNRDLLNPKAMLAALQSHAGAYLPQILYDGIPGEVLVEIFETEGGLTCRFNGQEYEMRPLRKLVK